jgi:pimeloyl-ACP methyl ester carboxylesterase
VQLQRHFANSKLIMFPGIGHLPYEECPGEFNRAVVEFLIAADARLTGGFKPVNP